MICNFKRQASLPENGLLDVVDLGVLADRGLHTVIGAVVNRDLAGSDASLERLVVLHGEVLEMPAGFCGGQADVIAVLQTKVAVGACNVAPCAGYDSSIFM